MTTLRSKKMRELCETAERLVLLTGTPVQNYVTEAHGVFGTFSL